MKECGLSARLPQLSSAVSAIKSSDGLPFRDTFSGEQNSAAIAKTDPGYRSRAFPPHVTLFAFMQQALVVLIRCKRLFIASIPIGLLLEKNQFQPMPPLIVMFVERQRSSCIADCASSRALLYDRLSVRRCFQRGISAEQIYFKGCKLKVMDGSSVLMSGTFENHQEFPHIASQEQGSGFPIARTLT